MRTARFEIFKVIAGLANTRSGGTSTRMFLPACAAAALAQMACAAGSFERGVFRSSQVAYRIGDPPRDWKPIRVEGANLAFHDQSGGSILVNAMCGAEHIDDVPLDVLVNQ